MALVDDVRRILDTGARPLLQQLGFRSQQVIVRTRTWTSGRPQTGPASVTDLPITPNPKVIGVAGDPTIKVTAITPAYPASSAGPAGGYTMAQIAPTDLAGEDWYYVVTFDDGVERPYQLLRATTTKELRYELELQTLDRVVPF